jgi:ABC-2 type transport system ATP-binding protein
LLWDLPPLETFALNRALYGISKRTYQSTLDDLVSMLKLEQVIDKPTRNLSLGERMKCELAAALIHRPEVLFLDEPTIGLDITMQVQVREFIRACNEHFKATVLLTSHYMQDIAAITPRVLIIDKGTLRFDGALEALTRKVAPERRIVVEGVHPELKELGFVQQLDEAVLTVPLSEANRQLARVLQLAPMAVFRVEAPPLEEVIGRVFEGKL